MRDLVLARIKEISDIHHGFSRHTMRWEHFSLNGVHISEIDLNTLSDQELTQVFENIIKRYYKQM